jgi:hypothetical protein
MEGNLHKHLKQIALLWLKGKVTDLTAPEVKLYVKRKKLLADAVGVNIKRKEVRFIEVKTSRQDLKRDEGLYDDRYSYAKLGNYAYIMSPVGVLDAEDLPEGYGWLEVDEDDQVVVRKNPHRNKKSSIQWDTLLKRTGRAITNTYLFSQTNREQKDHTSGEYTKKPVAQLIALTCLSCRVRHKYVTSFEQEHVTCKSCHNETTLSKGRKYVITQYNHHFLSELHEAIAVKGGM